MTTDQGSTIELIGHSDLDGSGDGMQITRNGDALYVGHLGTSGMSTSIVDISDPARPTVVRQFEAHPGSHGHKTQVGDGLLLVNTEQFKGGDPYRAGMAVYDVSDAFDPRPVGFFESGGRGVHRIVFTGGRYAYVSAIPDGFEDRIWVIVDLADPEHPVEAGRWWWPGMHVGGGETPTWPEGDRYAAHHALLDGEIAYLGFGDGNLVVLDVTDVTRPKQIGGAMWEPGGETHTCLPLPGRRLVVATDEAVRDDCQEPTKLVRVIDVTEPASPRVLSVCPPPSDDHCGRGLRFGPHNLHENLPGSYQSESLVFATYFNAGLRVYDISTPDAPVEVAWWEPDPPEGQKAPQINDLYVDDSLDIYVTDRITGGLYVLRPNAGLAAAMDAARL